MPSSPNTNRLVVLISPFSFLDAVFVPPSPGAILFTIGVHALNLLVTVGVPPNETAHWLAFFKLSLMFQLPVFVPLSRTAIQDFATARKVWSRLGVPPVVLSFWFKF